MSPKQIAFAQAYIICRNATQAAICAGYSTKTAQEQGSRLLSNVMVSEYLRANEKMVEDRFEITQEKILQELAAIAYSNPFQVIDTRKRIPEILARLSKGQNGVKSISINNKGISLHMHDKVAALKILAEHIGLFKSEQNDIAQDRKALLDRVKQLLIKSKN